MGKILDICCGIRMFHFDRENVDVISWIIEFCQIHYVMGENLQFDLAL